MPNLRLPALVGFLMVISCSATPLGAETSTSTSFEASPNPGTPVPAGSLDFELPEGWYVAEDDLTPNVGNPQDVLSVGTFPLVAGGNNCAHVPEAAMEALGSEDAFVSLQERSPIDDFRFDPRPPSFTPFLVGIDEGSDAFECIEPTERGDIGTLLWFSFGDEGRGFYLIVVIGTDAGIEVREQTDQLLESLDFGS